MLMKWKDIAIGGVLAVAAVQAADGSDRVNVRGMGMARTAVVVSRGLDAVGVNPANLALPGTDLMTLTILPLGAYLGTDFLTYDLYSRYLTGKSELIDLPMADKEIILDSFQGSMGTSRAEVAARLFGITLRTGGKSSVAFTVDYSLTGAATIPRPYAELLLLGNVPGSTFDVEGLAVQAFWARTYAVSFGTALPAPAFMTWLAGGVSLKLVQGYGYYEIEQLAASVHTGDDGLLSGAVTWRARSANTDGMANPLGSLFQNPAGYGVAFDIGLSGGLSDYLAFGVSVTDLGSMRWVRDVEQVSSDTAAVAESPDAFKSIRALSNAISRGRTTEQPFTSVLPSMIRVGVALQVERLAGNDFPGQLLVALEYLDGIGSNLLLGEEPRLSLGLEYKPLWWLPLRSGFSAGGSSTTQLAFGFGLHLGRLDIDVGTEDLFWLFKGRNSSSGSIGVGVLFRIR
jgi:hypothetical protein